MLLSIALAGQGIDKMFTGYGTEWGTSDSPRKLNHMITFRRTLADDGFMFRHDIANTAIRNQYRRLADQRDRRKTTMIRCENKGHAWKIRSQAEWDKGYDEPVICQRCGEWDM